MDITVALRSLSSQTRNGILISGFCRDVDVICGLLGDYTASCGNYHMTPCNHPKDHRLQEEDMAVGEWLWMQTPDFYLERIFKLAPNGTNAQMCLEIMLTVDISVT
jgi:hypothetical protein